ncbi:MAG: hypothetical protein KAS30_01490 [Candidatus Diapherotrites archaeon]|nr:hypothetical protein [Candidatus Diapherotrites archaeon]
MAIGDLYFLDAEGLHVPDYIEVLDFLKDAYRAIYGTDVYLEADSQDGQLVAVFALALFDTMQTNAASYNSYSPTTAIGDALTRQLKINGLQRAIPSNSTADLTLTGTVGTSISNAYAVDAAGLKWFLPSPSVIGAGGTVIKTATCEQEGAIEAPAGTITIIGTPTRGWLSVTNVNPATAGEAVEQDAEARIRQSISTMFPSQSVFEGLVAAVAALTGVTKQRGYENDTGGTVDSITAHTIALVVEGGVSQDIAEAIFNKKSVGCKTQGTTPVIVQDAEGNNNTINFYRPTDVPILVEVDADEVGTYVSDTDDLIKEAVAEYINNLDIGDDVLFTKLYTPANLPDLPQGETFNITAIRIDTVAGGTPAEADVTIAFNELASSIVGNITVTVTP